MKIKIFLLFLLLFSSAYATRVSQKPYIYPPETYEFSETEEKVLLLYLEHLGFSKSAKGYRVAIFYIQVGKVERAKALLDRVIEKDPTFVYALVQRGFIALWQNDTDLAYKLFDRASKLKNCSDYAIIGLEMVARRWANHHEHRDLVFGIYQKALSCNPKNPDTLFYLAELLYQMGRVNEAKELYLKALKYAPDNQDIWMGLARIYMLEGDDEKADEIYARFPDSIEPLKEEASSYFVQGDYQKAIELYKEVLEKDPSDYVATKRLAQSYGSTGKYTKAKKLYQKIIDAGCKSQSNWIQIMDTKSHTNIGMKLETNYVEAKEDDPNLQAPVVKDYYFLEAFTLYVPILDPWRLDLKELYFHQRENNIYRPSVNYSVYQSGFEAASRYFFAKDWRWDLSGRIYHAWGYQTGVTFPFRNTTRFEPGTTLLYNGPKYLLALSARRESFIIKNFAEGISEELKNYPLEITLGYSPSISFNPVFSAKGGWIFYKDSIGNKQEFQEVKFSSNLPHFHKLFKFTYLFKHSSFKYLTPNYFSYKNQYLNIFGGVVTIDFYKRGYLEASYEYSRQLTMKLIQPIGDFLFTAERQLLYGNRYKAKVGYRFQDKLKLEIGGHYFNDTLPYRDWRISGSLQAQF